ncbi:hypothetical protein M7I_0692 [Glarea lozoyensis 74030]|uniref:Uncharacterized protein n=1 Tax=Glarea lozoyensis (strain ATCC 74030 / MF5533) TaxID=1104152 RepID=H0EE24_GLAL7|nr:hypothetical protein M7I_0692 [Glarea lozoyensis 74030]
MNFQDQNVNLERPPESQHPANRQKIAESSVVPKDGSLDSPRSGDGLLTPDFNKPSLNLPADSPTLGPTSGTTGLSGMVRQHLRSDSNTSSVYGGASSAVRSPNVEKRNDGVKSAWERELESHHTRDGSTETQKERLDFKNELAERRRRVQENMKSFVEADSRSASPLPDLPSKSNPLGLLKSKSSRGSLVSLTLRSIEIMRIILSMVAKFEDPIPLPRTGHFGKHEEMLSMIANVRRLFGTKDKVERATTPNGDLKTDLLNPPMPQATQSTEEMSTFSDDGEPKSRNRQKLRKVSSEGGNLNAKARQAASAKPSPAMPTTTAFTAPRGNSPPRPPPSEGGMF